jgi:hypothetical protein
MIAMTFSAVHVRLTLIASASRVCSSTMLQSFRRRRSAVSSNWKSTAHTSFALLARKRAACHCLDASACESSQAAAGPPGARFAWCACDYRPAVPEQDRVRRLPSPPRVLPGDLAQPAR